MDEHLHINNILEHVKPRDLKEYIEASMAILEPDIQSLLEGMTLATEHFSEECREWRQMATDSVDSADEIIQRLLKKASTAQRTLEWYKQGQEVLTASQFATITKAPRTRGQLVLEKAKPIEEKDMTTKPLCVRTQDIRAFDWGIRFEPIIKQIYELYTNSKVADLGRIIHPTDNKLAASPDGLVVEGEKTKGRLVEFKAPISRQIKEEEVPKDYWTQMQIQMEVCGAPQCDYFEVQFSSPAGIKEWKEPVSTEENSIKIHYKGKLYLIGNKETEQPIRYYYPSDINNENDNNPEDLKDDEIVLEIIPWFCTGFQLKTIKRDQAWFESMKEPIRKFWEDVASAKEGKFVLPEVTRKRKAEACLIRDD